MNKTNGSPRIWHSILFLTIYLSPLAAQTPQTQNHSYLLQLALQRTDKPILIRAQQDPFDLDAMPVHRSPRSEKPISPWQLFLMRLGCSLFFTAANVYEFIALKISAINHYFHPQLDTDTTTTYTAPIARYELR